MQIAALLVNDVTFEDTLCTVKCKLRICWEPLLSLSIDPFHNQFRIGLCFRLDSGKESITMYSAKMPIESIVILSKLFSP